MSEELDRMYEVGSNSEAATLDDLRQRAGLIWKCQARRRDAGTACGWFNAEDDATCERCGEAKP